MEEKSAVSRRAWKSGKINPPLKIEIKNKTQVKQHRNS